LKNYINAKQNRAYIFEGSVIMPKEKVLVVDDDSAIRYTLTGAASLGIRPARSLDGGRGAGVLRRGAALGGVAGRQNVRELRNVIERVMILEDSDVITADWLPRGLIGDERTVVLTPVSAVSQPAESATPSFRLPEAGIDLEQVELSLARQAMERSGGNQTRAAELLGVSRDQLRYRLKKIEDAQPGR
jgi:hypothetical protein